MTRSDSYGAFLAMLLSNRETFFEEVVDGAGLETRSCECYGRGNQIYEQALG